MWPMYSDKPVEELKNVLFLGKVNDWPGLEDQVVAASANPVAGTPDWVAGRLYNIEHKSAYYAEEYYNRLSLSQTLKFVNTVAADYDIVVSFGLTDNRVFAWAQPDYGMIVLNDYYLNKGVILHEIAHLMQGDEIKTNHHGPNFQWWLVTLLTQYYPGKYTDKFLELYNE